MTKNNLNSNHEHDPDMQNEGFPSDAEELITEDEAPKQEGQPQQQEPVAQKKKSKKQKVNTDMTNVASDNREELQNPNVLKPKKKEPLRNPNKSKSIDWMVFRSEVVHEQYKDGDGLTRDTHRHPNTYYNDVWDETLDGFMEKVAQKHGIRKGDSIPIT